MSLICSATSNVDGVSVSLQKDDEILKAGDFTVSYQLSPVYRNASGSYKCHASLPSIYPDGKTETFKLSVICKL